MATKPDVFIDFKQLATTLMQRSERGTAVLFLADDTPPLFFSIKIILLS